MVRIGCRTLGFLDTSLCTTLNTKYFVILSGNAEWRSRRICGSHLVATKPVPQALEDIDLFTPIFAVSRIAGWAAHVIEQLDDNRLIRPRAEYIGPEYPAPYIPLAAR